MVARRLLPASPSYLLDRQDRMITGARPRSVSRHVGRTRRRNHDGRATRTRGLVEANRVVGGIPVTRPRAPSTASISVMPATRANAHGLPGGDRIRGQPHGDITSLDQRSVVCRPIPDVVFCLVLRVHPRLHVEIMRGRRYDGQDVERGSLRARDLCTNAAATEQGDPVAGAGGQHEPKVGAIQPVQDRHGRWHGGPNTP